MRARNHCQSLDHFQIECRQILLLAWITLQIVQLRPREQAVLVFEDLRLMLPPETRRTRLGLLVNGEKQLPPAIADRLKLVPEIVEDRRGPLDQIKTRTKVVPIVNAVRRKLRASDGRARGKQIQMRNHRRLHAPGKAAWRPDD